jgi:transmembrane 9 superfamily protein 2/4
LACASEAFYVPGVTPHTFHQGEVVKIRVNKLTSAKTMLPYEFYTLPFPKPTQGVKEQPENLGEYLSGNRIENSGYKLKFLDNTECQLLARSTFKKEQIDAFKKAIREEYRVNWIIDNLPSAAAIDDYETKTQTVVYDTGFPIGHYKESTTPGNEKFELYNHAKMTVLYHSPQDVNGDFNPYQGRIVGFLVEPITVGHKYPGTWDESKGATQLETCYDGMPQPSMDSRRKPQPLDHEHTEVIWTYDVIWKHSDIAWASRWDIYLSMAGRYDDEVHWFSISSALLIVFCLGGIVALILMRAVHRDIQKYNKVMTEEEREEMREESGWKLVHADVFRPPAFMPMLFCVCNGSGVQLFIMTSLLIFFSAVGFLSPARRGSVVTWFLLLFVGMGMSAGHVAASMYRMFNGRDWRTVILYTALFVPSVFFGVSFILNLIVWAEGSVRAIPFGSMVVVIMLWFLVSVPLVCVGGYMGYKKKVADFPVAVGKTPRPIPPQPFYWSLPIACLVAGILPFSAVFVELFFIYSSIWLGQYYYVFGFLLLTFVILVATCAEVSIVFCYFQLCNEDHHWWWRSFCTGGSLGIYVFLYSIYFFFNQLHTIYLTTSLLYFSYTGMISGLLFLITGTVGYHVCFWFNMKIYGSIKVD